MKLQIDSQKGSFKILNNEKTFNKHVVLNCTNIIVGFLFIVNVPFPILYVWIAKSFPNGMYIFVKITTIILLSIFLFLQRQGLEIYNINKVSFILLIVSWTILNAGYPLIVILGWIFGIGLFYLLIEHQFEFINTKKDSPKWILSASLIGVIIPLIVWLLYQYIFSSKIQYSIQNLILWIKNFLIDFSNFSVIEEFLFRGVFWGTLRRAGWKDSSIFLIITILFWFCHITQKTNYISLFFVIPLIACLNGFYAMKSRSLTPGIIIHILYNNLAYIFFM